MSTSDRLGAGLRFPPVPRQGRLEPVDGPAAVAQSLEALLLTEPGERIGRPDYGCGLAQYLFAPNSVTTRSAIRRSIEEAIVRFEPRVDLEEVEVRSDAQAPTRLLITLRYHIAGVIGPQNMVFPFYLEQEL